jgi:uncharacterized protein (DUF433 family)
MSLTFSLKEAATIADVPERRLRRGIEQNIIRSRTSKVGRVLRHRIEGRDLVFIKLLTAFPFPVNRTDLESWHQLITHRCSRAGRWRMDDCTLVSDSEGVEVRVELKSLRQVLARHLLLFRFGRRRIVTDPEIVGGEPLFAGTRIPLSHITGLIVKGVPMAEIAEDYSTLSLRDLEYAALVAPMRPNPGRPRRPLTLFRSGHPIKTKDVRVSGRATSS